MYLLGLDVGGTKIESVVLHLHDAPSSQNILLSGGAAKSYDILGRKRIDTQRHLGYDTVMNNMTRLILDLMKELGLSIQQMSSIGMGLPGSIHPSTQKMINGNTGIFIDKDIAGDLGALLGVHLPIHLANDANCFALAETIAGAGALWARENKVDAHHLSCIGIILGTGVGGGLILGTSMVEGKSGGACEVGHTTLYDYGHPCYCGRRGCAEQYLSGPALEASYVSRIYARIDHRPTSKQIFELEANREPSAMSVIQEYKRDLAKFLGNLSQTYDPHLFVLGGGMSNELGIYKNLESHLVDELFLRDFPPAIRKHHLGDSAGVIGAAILPWWARD